eukprot:9467142-Pyramimonas_sp.AAC.1
MAERPWGFDGRISRPEANEKSSMDCFFVDYTAKKQRCCFYEAQKQPETVGAVPYVSMMP